MRATRTCMGSAGSVATCRACWDDCVRVCTGVRVCSGVREEGRPRASVRARWKRVWPGGVGEVLVRVWERPPSAAKDATVSCTIASDALLRDIRQSAPRDRSGMLVGWGCAGKVLDGVMVYSRSNAEESVPRVLP